VDRGAGRRLSFAIPAAAAVPVAVAYRRSAVGDLLVQLHDLIERAATDHHGFVVSYMGDCAMIVFGLPAPQPGVAACALAAVPPKPGPAWMNMPPMRLSRPMSRGRHRRPSCRDRRSR